jgi:hypothetical protein
MAICYPPIGRRRRRHLANVGLGGAKYMTSPTVFRTWRTAWMALEGIPALLAGVDARLRRRERGNHFLPNWRIAANSEAIRPGIPI